MSFQFRILSRRFEEYNDKDSPKITKEHSNTQTEESPLKKKTIRVRNCKQPKILYFIFSGKKTHPIYRNFCIFYIQLSQYPRRIKEIFLPN